MGGEVGGGGRERRREREVAIRRPKGEGGRWDIAEVGGIFRFGGFGGFGGGEGNVVWVEVIYWCVVCVVKL